MMTSHVRRLRVFGGVGICFVLVGAVIAATGNGGAGAGLAVTGAVLTLWECAALALVRRWSAPAGTSGTRGL